MTFDIFKVDRIYYKAYLTHDFDIDNYIEESYSERYGRNYIDYKCKHCGIFLVENNDKKYIINIRLLLNNSSIYSKITCNEILMEQILK